MDTLDYDPPPVLPPRRPPWPFNSPSSTASRYIGQHTTTIAATTSPLTPTAATTTITSTTPLTTTLVPAPSASQGSTTSSSARVSPQPPPLTPPQYPAPPRPPSRNGESELSIFIQHEFTFYRHSIVIFITGILINLLIGENGSSRHALESILLDILSSSLFLYDFRCYFIST